MKKIDFPVSYEYRAKGFDKPESFKKHADKAVKEIFASCGHDIDIKINLEPEVRKKNYFKVVLTSKTYEGRVILKKSSRNVYLALKYLKRKFIRHARKVNNYKTNKKRKVAPPNKQIIQVLNFT